MLGVQAGSYPVMVPPFYPPVNSYPYVHIPTSKPVVSPGRQTDPSSDGSEMEAMHPFPSIADFLENLSDSLAGKNRDILEFLEKFESKRVYCLDELKGVSVDGLKPSLDWCGATHVFWRRSSTGRFVTLSRQGKRDESVSGMSSPTDIKKKILEQKYAVFTTLNRYNVLK